MKNFKNLNNKNFLSIFDVSRNIHDEISWFDIDNGGVDFVLIKDLGHYIEANLVKFLPSGAISSKVEYRKLRYKALDYLKDNGYINNYECEESGISHGIISVELDIKKFDNFYNEILEEYNNQVSKSNKEKRNVFDFEKEKKSLAKIKLDIMHWKYRDKWLNIRRVFNVIDNQRLPAPLGGDIPEIKISKNDFFEEGISEKKENVIYEILLCLKNSNLIDIKKPDLDGHYIVTYDKRGVFLNDRVKILIKDLDQFENWLEALYVFISYIEKDGEERFPEFYGERIFRNKKSKVSKPKKKTKEKVIFSLPMSKGFMDVEIKFLVDDFFEISVGEKNEKFHGLELGLLKGKNNKYIPKESLNFLLKLSLNNGIYPLKTLSQEERGCVTSRKKELTKIFREVFGERDDPFYKYNKDRDEHRIKIKLIPPLNLKEMDYINNRMIVDDNEKKQNKFDDLNEYRKENSPLM